MSSKKIPKFALDKYTLLALDMITDEMKIEKFDLMDYVVSVDITDIDHYTNVLMLSHGIWRKIRKLIEKDS